MRRLLATARVDVRLQHRNGFYYAVAVVLALFAILISQIPEVDWSPWLAPLLLSNLVMVSFFFIGGLVLLEKGEGTLEVQVVTPLRVGEYLGAKIGTLGALSLVENLVMVVLVSGLQHRFGLLVLGITCASVIYTLIGFIAVARYDSINAYLMPATAYILLLSLPYLDYFELWVTPGMILHPMQGPLIIMEAAFLPVSGAELATALVATTLWIVITAVLARRTFRRFVIRKEGTR